MERKAHWGTAPGMGGCVIGAGTKNGTGAEIRCPSYTYPTEAPLLFNVCIDPSEGMPASGALASGNNPGPSPPDSTGPYDEVDAALTKIVAAYKVELATFTHGSLVAPELLPGEANGQIRLCCDK